jgi:hypothetical protein
MRNNLFLGENMSHFTTYKTELTGVTETQVRDAMQELAKQIGAHITTNATVKRFGYNENVLAELKNTDVPSGIGVRVQDGKLVVCGDDWNQEVGFAKMKKLIIGYATVHKVKMNAKLHKMPATVKIREHEILLEVG